MFNETEEHDYEDDEYGGPHFDQEVWDEPIADQSAIEDDEE